MKNVIIADVDDTICPSTRPVAGEMAAEIGRLAGRGWVVAFISGSTMEQIGAQLTPHLSVQHHLLAASGSHYKVVAPDGDSREIYRLAFDEPEKKRILGAFEGLIRRHGLRSETTAQDQLQDRGSQITLSAIGRGASDAAKRAFDPDGSRRDAWVLELTRELGSGLNIRRGGTTSIDITPAGIDKEWGIRRFLKENGLDAGQAVFYGDNLQPGGNDFPATRVVDCVEVAHPGHTLELFRSL
jgi:phosphomannomutase